jgi:hypothetical protein
MEVTTDALLQHTQVVYAPFRRAFYTEVAELSKMDEKEVAALRKELDGIKVCASRRTPVCVQGIRRGAE